MEHTGFYDCRDKILKVDGRLKHRLKMDNFEGERFTVIFFKNGDRRMSAPAPIVKVPHFLPWK